jgi:hypothetical protein
MACQVDVPDAAELAGGEVRDPRLGWSSWSDWAEERWPSLQIGELE